MKIALIGDLHGNLVALEAVAAHIQTQQVDSIYCLGDLIGKGPDSPATMDWAIANCDVVLQGNWDEAIWCDRNPNPTVQWFRKQLGQQRLDTLSKLPFEHRMLLSGRKVRLLHGRNLVPDTVFSDSSKAERLELFRPKDGYRPDLVAFADVHTPFYQQIIGGGILLNTGSVGNPLHSHPQPSYAILEGTEGERPATLSMAFMQLEYDREAAIRRAQEVPTLPKLDAFIREVRTGQYSR